MDGVGGASTHPQLEVVARELEVAGQQIRVARTDFMPKLNVQYGRQSINGASGFYQYQFGMTLPLFYRPQQGRLQSAKINRDIAEQNLREQSRKMRTQYLNALEAYHKWSISWQYYRNEALDLARKQREAAWLAYQEGAIDYVSFLQNVKDAIKIEIQAWDALENYLNSRFQLEYFTPS